VPGYEASNWNGIVVRSGTPAAITTLLNREVIAILGEPKVAETLTGAGLEPVGDTPQQFSAYLRSEANKWQALVKRIGITAEGR
jgi:tripartite-type tricarboxylate transporter receptor subunit TctC